MVGEIYSHALLNKNKSEKLFSFLFFFFAQPLRQMFPLPACKIRGGGVVFKELEHTECVPNMQYTPEKRATLTLCSLPAY